MRIREATHNDAKVLAELGAKTFYDTFRPHNTEEDMLLYIKKNYSTETIFENLSNTNIQYFIAFDDEIPIGYIKLIKNKTFEKLDTKNNIELEKIYVLNTYHDKKAGKELMLAAIQFSIEKKFETLFLGVWQENKRAIDFYKKFKFETFATRAFKLGNEICDDFMMKLGL